METDTLYPMSRHVVGRLATGFPVPALVMALSGAISALSAQVVENDSVEVVARIEGRSPSVPFGAVTDVGTSESLARVYVLDALNGEVTVFTATGENLFHVGRLGEGSGEMSNRVRRLFVFGDGSFGVADRGLLRVSLWNASGELMDDWPISLEDGNPLRWRAAGQDLIAELSPTPRHLMQAVPARNKLVSFDLDGSGYRVIHQFEDVAPLSAFGPGGTIVLRPRPEITLWTTDGNGAVLVGRSRKYEVADISGRTNVRISRDFSARPVSDEIKDRIRADFQREMEKLGRRLPEIEYPTHHAVIGAIHSAPSGEILVRHREYDQAGEALPDSYGRLFDVFDEAGTYMRSLRLPGGFVLRGIVNESFVGRVRDELDVPSVVILRLKSWETRSAGRRGGA